MPIRLWQALIFLTRCPSFLVSPFYKRHTLCVSNGRLCSLRILKSQRLWGLGNTRQSPGGEDTFPDSGTTDVEDGHPRRLAQISHFAARHEDFARVAPPGASTPAAVHGLGVSRRKSTAQLTGLLTLSPQPC